MSNFNKPTINETFIIEPMFVGAEVVSACTEVFTNMVTSCSGNTSIILGTDLIIFNSNIYTNDSISATTINASAYFSGGTNLIDIFSSTDIHVTGGTFNYVTKTLTLIESNGTIINVTGFTDYFITGITYTNNQITIQRNDGVKIGASINSFTALTITEKLTTKTISATTLSADTAYINNSTINSLSANTFTVNAIYASNGIFDSLSATTISATTYYNVSSNFQYEIHVSQVDGNDTTGNGTLLNPVATITKALTLIIGLRRTIIVHPGNYTESPSITVQYTTITGPGLIGGNILISGTISTNTGCSISGLKMTNLNITAPTGTGNVNVLNCDISGTLTKSNSGDYTLIRFCDIGTTTITSSAGLVAIFGGNPNFITINNAGARVIVKNSVTVAPVLTAGNANFVDCIVIATTSTSNALTTAAGTIVNLSNSQIIVPTFDNVARVSLSGFYSIFNTVFDKPNSTLIATSGTGGSTNSIDYFQYINADKFIIQGGTSSQFLKANGSLDNSDYYLSSNPNSYISLTGLSSNATGLTYTNTTGVFSLTSGYTIPTTISQNEWNTAYTNRITSLTTTGTTGSSTLINNVLNIPNYSTNISGLVPYTGATADVNIGQHDLYTKVLKLYDNPEDAYGTFRLSDNIFSAFKSDGEPVFNTEQGYFSFNLTDTIASTFNNNNLTQGRNYQLPNASGNIPLTVNGITANTSGNITIPIQSPITLTTTGTTGASTLIGANLNIPQYISSQWTTTGTSIYYNTGNVLIGKTTNSVYKLDVSGSTRFNGQTAIGTTGYTYGTTVNSGGKLTINNLSGYNGLVIDSDDGASNGTYHFSINTTKNDNLGVQFGWSDGNAGSFLQCANNTGTILGLGTNTTIKGTTILFKQGSTEVARFAPSSGNLLLGTTTDTAGYKLQVVGNIITDNGSISANYDGGFILTGGVGQIVRRPLNSAYGIGYYGAASYTQGHIFGLLYTDNYAHQSGTRYGIQNLFGMAAAGAGSGSTINTNLKYTINNIGTQTGTFTGLIIDATETALSGMTHNLIDLKVDGNTKLKVKNDGSIGVNISTPNSSAILDLTSTTQGFLPPRMTSAERLAITSPAIGLMVYQTDSVEGWYGYKSTGWKSLTTA